MFYILYYDTYTNGSLKVNNQYAANDDADLIPGHTFRPFTLPGRMYERTLGTKSRIPLTRDRDEPIERARRSFECNVMNITRH